MSDRQQQQPLKKATPRHNNKSQLLENISVGLENYGIKFSRREVVNSGRAVKIEQKVEQVDKDQNDKQEQVREMKNSRDVQLQSEQMSHLKQIHQSYLALNSHQQPVINKEQQSVNVKPVQTLLLKQVQEQNVGITPSKEQPNKINQLHSHSQAKQSLSQQEIADSSQSQQQQEEVFKEDGEEKLVKGKVDQLQATNQQKEEQEGQGLKRKQLALSPRLPSSGDIKAAFVYSPRRQQVVSFNQQKERKQQKSPIKENQLLKSPRKQGYLESKKQEIQRNKIAEQDQNQIQNRKPQSPILPVKTDKLYQTPHGTNHQQQANNNLSAVKKHSSKQYEQFEQINKQVENKSPMKQENIQMKDHNEAKAVQSRIQENYINQGLVLGLPHSDTADLAYRQPQSQPITKLSRTIQKNLLFEQVQRQVQQLHSPYQPSISPQFYSNEIDPSSPSSSIDKTRNYQPYRQGEDGEQEGRKGQEEGKGGKIMEPQKEEPEEQPQCFDLNKYKSAQPILQQLLHQLKQTLRQVKQQKPRHQPIQNRTSNSKFFGKASRSQSKNKNSLMDILERRKHNKLPQQSANSIRNTHIVNQTRENRVNIEVPGGRSKVVPYGLGNFGQPQLQEFNVGVVRNHQQPYMGKRNDGESNSGSNSRMEEEERERLIKNRNKINEILASSVSNFKRPLNDTSRQKAGSFFVRQPQPQNNQRHDETSFVAQSQNSKKQNFHSRKIIKSNNFNKIPNKQINSASQIPSSQATIQRERQRAFFSNQPITQKPIVTPVTSVLKLVRKYLQVIAEGRIDEIEAFLHNAGQGSVTANNLNELINRKKLFKTALYFQRAAIVAGVCYGYLIITEERGYLAYKVQALTQNKGNRVEQSSRQSSQSMKQQTKQILKYMINLTSFSLNNCKMISKTIQEYFITTTLPSQQNQQLQRLKPRQYQQQLLIQKQIYKRNIETIKLNIQYIQQTLQKMFVQSRNPMVDEDFGESFKNVTKIIQKNSIQESFYTLLEYFSFYLALIRRQKSIPFLAVAPNPYLDPTQRYTLVIDFVSVFCNGTKKSKTFIFRPYSQHFLLEMSQYFDIVVISDALPQQIDKIIDILDTKGVIQHRLYKYHMVEERATGKYTKNLQRIGRDMSRTILLDVQTNRVSAETKNTIYINEWKGSKHDSKLAELCSVLISIVVGGLDCGRAAIKIDRQMKVNLRNGIKHVNFGLDLRESDKGSLAQCQGQEEEQGQELEGQYDQWQQGEQYAQ